jgi:hypothetical protein
VLDEQHPTPVKETSWAKPRAILRRSDKSFDHLSLDEVSLKLIEFLQPEVVPIHIVVRRVIGITAQVPKILHQHNCSIELSLVKVSILNEITPRREGREATPSLLF